jgi:predicted PurR-regulated permease PerM
MVNFRQPRDIAQVLLSVLFLAIMIVACLWIVQPFILGFAWAGTVVIAACYAYKNCSGGVARWQCW